MDESMWVGLSGPKAEIRWYHGRPYELSGIFPEIQALYRPHIW
jgi:hypothetical protein